MKSEIDKPLVSVVMPVYNGEKYLREAIESVLNQSYSNIELIIVNDASTDSTKSIIHSYSDSRIQYVENEVNLGIVKSRNRGIDASNGEFIANLDSDDIAVPERIEKQLAFLSDNPDFGMCGTFYHTIDSKGNQIQPLQFPTTNEDIITSMLLGNCFGNSTVMIRGHFARELKYRTGYDIAEDFDLWCRISKISKLANLPFYGTLYRVHGNNVSIAKMNELLTVERKIIRQILEDLRIEFTEKEFDMHVNFFKRNIDYFKEGALLQELESWLTKFYATVVKDNKYNALLLLRLIADKWMVIAFGIRRYNLLLYNKIFNLNRGLYIKCLHKRIISKMAS